MSPFLASVSRFLPYGSRFCALGIDFGLLKSWKSSFGTIGVNFGPLRNNFGPLEVDFWPVECKFGLWWSNFRPLGFEFICQAVEFGALCVVIRSL